MTQPTLHQALCIVAIILGVLFWANAIHVGSLHAAVGIILVTIAVLSAL